MKKPDGSVVSVSLFRGKSTKKAKFVLILFRFCFALRVASIVQKNHRFDDMETKSVTISMRRMSLYVLFLLLTTCHTLNTVSLEPGVGFRSRDGSMQVVLFEHTEQYGSGGLVLNQPTPLRVKDLHIPIFHKAFADNSLMLGGGMTNDRETNVAITDMAPWFWLHTVPNLPKATLL